MQLQISTPATRITMGEAELDYPEGELGQLQDSNDLLGDAVALRERMDGEGYLYLRQFIDRAKVLKARETILKYMADHDALVPSEPILEGVMPKAGKTVSMLGRNKVTQHPDLLAVYEGVELFNFFNQYFNESAATFDYKWLRGVGNEGFSGAHYDVVYMGRGSEQLYTCWVPFDDLPIQKGTPVMCAGSHNSPNFKPLRDSYGRMDVDRDDAPGWFTSNPRTVTEKFGGRWLTTDFQAGDVMIFGMYTMHGSTTNITNRYRLSADVRFQPASDPVDERWLGAGLRTAARG